MTQQVGWLSIGFLFQELLEQRIGSELKSMKSSLVLIEKSTINNLRSENEVRTMGWMTLKYLSMYLPLLPSGTKESNPESDKCV